MAEAQIFKETIFAINAFLLPSFIPLLLTGAFCWLNSLGGICQSPTISFKYCHCSLKFKPKHQDQVTRRCKWWEFQTFHFQSKKGTNKLQHCTSFCTSCFHDSSSFWHGEMFAFDPVYKNKHYNGVGSHPWSFVPFPFSQKWHLPIQQVLLQNTWTSFLTLIHSKLVSICVPLSPCLETRTYLKTSSLMIQESTREWGAGQQ